MQSFKKHRLHLQRVMSVQGRANVLRKWIASTAFAIATVITFAISAPASAKVEGDTITLGVVTSLSGKYSINGKIAAKGFNLTVKVINDQGGVRVGGKAWKLKVKYYDDKSTPALSAQLMERLITQDGIKYMLGPYSSATTKAVAPVIDKYRIPMVEAHGASRSLFRQGYQYLFAVLSTSEQYLASSITLAAEIAEKNGRRPGDLKLALVFENDPFSLDVRAGVIDDASKYGMEIVIDDKMPYDLGDISASLAKVKELKPDLLMISGHGKGALTGARQIKEMRIDVPMIAITHCEAAKIVSEFGAATNGILCPAQWADTLSYEGDMFGTAAEFDKLFASTYSEFRKAPYQAAQAAAAVLVWRDAFERANSFDTELLRTAISETNLKTFYGFIRFSKTGYNIAKPMVLRQIQNGEYNVVAPSNWASHLVQWPRKVPDK
jgi:branched-chain amino acid transport system substrate-binding protein